MRLACNDKINSFILFFLNNYETIYLIYIYVYVKFFYNVLITIIFTSLTKFYLCFYSQYYILVYQRY